MAQIAEGATRNSHPGRPGVDRVTRAQQWSARSSHHHGLRANGWGDEWRHVDQGGGPINRSTDPATPTARLPHPAESRYKRPGSVTVRQPSPRVGRRIQVPETGIPAPRAIHEWVPSDTREVRLPHHAVAGHVGVGAVVVEVAQTITVGRRRRVVLGVLIVVGDGFFVPRIEWGLGDLVFDLGFVITGGVEGRGFLLLHGQLAVWPIDLQVALEYSQISDFRRCVDTEVGGTIEGDLFAREIEGKIVFAEPVDVGHALDEIDLRDSLPGISQAQLAEFHGRVRSETHGTAVFKLHLGSARRTGFEMNALSNRQVDKSVFESESGVFVDLNRALDVAQSNNAGLRLGKGWNR